MYDHHLCQMFRALRRTLATKTTLTTLAQVTNYRWGDLIEFSAFNETFSLGVVTNVIQETGRTFLTILHGTGRLKVGMDAFFVRYHSPRFLGDKEGEGLRVEGLKSLLEDFEARARDCLNTNFKKFEALFSKSINRQGTEGHSSANLIYEEDMVRRAFGKGFENYQAYAVHLYLHSYRERFARDSAYQVTNTDTGPYYLRSQKDLALLSQVNSTIEEPDEALLHFSQALRARRHDNEPFIMRVEYEPFITVIEKAALMPWQDSITNPFMETAQRMLKGIAPASKSSDLLSLILLLGLEERIAKKDVPIYQSALRISPNIGEAQKQLASIDVEATTLDESRVIFTEEAYAIDSENTIEVDDAISLEVRGSSNWIHVHIADPSEMVKFDSKEDLEAREKALTAYFVHSMHPMLSRETALRTSLDPNKKYNPCITFSLHLDSQGEIADYQISRGVLTNLKRITYETALNYIGKDSNIRRLCQIGRFHKRHRINRGAIDIDIPRGRISIKDGSKLSFNLPQRDIFHAHNMVAEMMILAGRAAAHYFKERHVHIPFRYHVDPRHENPLAGELSTRIAAGEGTFFDKLHLLSLLSPSAVNILPQPHWAMGLESYCQSTSPLRRYFDLLIHHQLQRTLREQKAIPKESLESMMSSIYRHEQYLKRLMRSSDRYWTLRFIEGALFSNGNYSEAIDLETVRVGHSDSYRPIRVKTIPIEYSISSGTLQLWIEEFALRIYATVPGASELMMGEPVPMEIVAVDPIRQKMKLQLLG